MSNTSPKEGDERYLPISWKVSEEHTWSSSPYEAAFTINQAGSYTLQVTFRKQTYTNGLLDEHIVHQRVKSKL